MIFNWVYKNINLIYLYYLSHFLYIKVIHHYRSYYIVIIPTLN